jgi:hypothetical protein
MILKDCKLLIDVISSWCLDQEDITGVSFRIDMLISTLVVTLEWDCGRKMYRVSHGFSADQVKLSRDYSRAIEIIAEKISKTRIDISSRGDKTYQKIDY